MAGGRINFAIKPLRLVRWSGRRGRIVIEIGDGLVQVTERTLFRKRQWREPLAGYIGVQLNSSVGPGSEFGMRRWHEAVLRHRDPKKTIPLASSRNLCEVRKTWKHAAFSFGLPAIERTPVGYIARDEGDLDKPYSALSRARLMARLADLNRAPVTIDCRRRGPVTRAMLRLNGLEILPALLLLMVGLVFLVLGSGLGITCSIAGVLLLLLGINARRGIEVSPEGVSSAWMTPLGDFRRRAIPFDELHTVTWTGSDMPRRRNASLLLASDHTEISLDNLPRQQADWLGRLVLYAAMAREPRIGA